MPGFSAANVKNTRVNYVDLLRGIAVLLVLCRHWHILDYLGNLGWMGVDLFFVISGFLISGLLFNEHEKQGNIDFPRFFIRRGLKIYPLFYLLLIVSFLVMILTGSAVNYKAFIKEALFIQNYFGGLYLHTWSLAIEEHFYLLLMLCFALFMKKRDKIPYIFLVFILAPLAFRLWKVSGDDFHNHFYTHTRIDSLFMGAFLCYVWKYRKEKMAFLNSSFRYLLLALCLGCLSIFGWIEPEKAFVQGIGFTLIGLSFAGILLYVLTSKSTDTFMSRPFAFVGFYSYSVYLLHIPVKVLLEHFDIMEGDEPVNTANFFLYVFICVATGVIFSEMIEQPILKWRNRRFPSRA